jgi:hypothetical protein
MQRMRDMLRGSLARSLRELSAVDRLSAAWPVACGPSMAAHGEVLHLDDEQFLHVRVSGAEWMQQFLHMRSALAADLSRIAGVRLAGIHFEDREEKRTRARRQPGSAPAATPNPRRSKP